MSDIQKRNFVRGKSLLLGALALSEKFISKDPIPKGEFNAIENEISRQLDRIKWLPEKSGQRLIGLVWHNTKPGVN